MLKLVFLTGLLLSVTPAVAQTQPPVTSSAAKPAQSNHDANRLICETEQEIGSRLASKRICMTAAQWKEREQQIHSQLDQQHINVESMPGPG